MKQYNIAVNHNGKFEVVGPGSNDDVCLSQTDEKLFLYICFLNVAEFWSHIVSARNIHHINKSLLVKNFVEYLDKTVCIENLINRTLMLKRQIIIVTMPMKKKRINDV